MVELTQIQTSFLNAINRNKHHHTSMLLLGKEYFKTARSVYLVLYKLQDLRLVILEKGNKNLIVTVTPKGQKYLLEQF